MPSLRAPRAPGARVAVPRVRPTIVPRACGSQSGAPSPTSAGTKYTPSLDSSDAASASVSDGVRHDAQSVAQPLHRGAGDEDRRLERVRGCARRIAPDGGENARRRRRALIAGVQEHERAGAVGVLSHPGRPAPLAEERRLLVAGHAADRNPGAEPLGAARCRTRRSTGAPRAASRGARRTARTAASLHARASMSYSMVRDAFEWSVAKTCAAGQLPDEPRCPRCRPPVRRARTVRASRSSAHQPFEFGGREIRIDHEAGAGADTIGVRCAVPRSGRRSAGPATPWRGAPAGRCARSQTTTVSR